MKYSGGVRGWGWVGGDFFELKRNFFVIFLILIKSCRELILKITSLIFVELETWLYFKTKSNFSRKKDFSFFLEQLISKCNSFYNFLGFLKSRYFKVDWWDYKMNKNHFWKKHAARPYVVSNTSLLPKYVQGQLLQLQILAKNFIFGRLTT